MDSTPNVPRTDLARITPRNDGIPFSPGYNADVPRPYKNNAEVRHAVKIKEKYVRDAPRLLRFH